MGNHLARAYALGYLALISVEQGRWMVCQAVAKILDERGGTDAAFHNADTAVRLARRGGGLFGLAGALITRAELAGRGRRGRGPGGSNRGSSSFAAQRRS
jgi:LuxR family maltose regulon positive regulatory protein